MTVQPLHTLVNGNADGTISVADRGLSFGDGVFETLSLSNGKLQFWLFHRERLLTGLSQLKINCEPDVIDARVKQFLEQAANQQLQQGIVKIIVTRGQGRGYAPQTDSEPTIILSLFPSPLLANDYSRDGVTITVCSQRLSYQPALLGIKHLNRLDNVLAALEIQKQNLVEGLLLDDQDHVVEGVSRNLFVVKKGALQMPDLQRAGIQGVMQRVICETLAPQLKLTVTAAAMELSHVLSADEIFLCNSITGIWPVIAIDDRKFTVGPITKTLQTALTQLRRTD